MKFKVVVVLSVICTSIFRFRSDESTAFPDLVKRILRIPPSFRHRPPFNVRKRLWIPRGFRIHLMARVPAARFLLALPNDDVLVSQPWDGRISLLRKHGGSLEIYRYLHNLRMPHDMVLYEAENGTQYVYVAESDRVTRYEYTYGQTDAGTEKVIVEGLPDGSSPELKGRYHHALKNIAIHNTTLYVSIGSATNADPNDLLEFPKRGAIYAYPVDGANITDGELIAEGIRNAEGLAFAPGTDNLWVVVNQRDNVKYPYKDEPEIYNTTVVEYVDDNPPEEFSRVIKGLNYGWPFCNPVPSPSMDDLHYIPDVDTNPEESVVNCSSFRPVDKGIEAHSAPLGLTFWTGNNVPSPFQRGALVAMHGSWNRRTYSGHKVVFYSWVNGRPGESYDLVSGWVTNATSRQRWGCPVDTAVLQDGSVLISDDYNGAIYRLYKYSPTVKKNEENIFEYCQGLCSNATK